MSVVTIVGAGMMGSAMSMPARDNGHEVRLVGTPLDREIIESVKANGYHPTMDRQLPDKVQAFQFEEIENALKNTDFVIGGVSSFGVQWFAEQVLPLIPKSVPLLMVTKGLIDQENGDLQTFPDYFQELVDHNLSINAVGGPCTSYELADRRHSVVRFCGNDLDSLERLKKLLETNYYHIAISNDVIGVESAVALKNAYALGVAFAIGLQEKEMGIGCVQAYNSQAALFGQASWELSRLVKVLGGTEESIYLGVGDLYVTIYGGRTRKLGILLGRGLTFDDAINELSGITLESVTIATRAARGIRKLAERGVLNIEDFPLLQHVDDVINKNNPVSIPWKDFTRNHII